MIEHRWDAVDTRKIGIGNISLAGGAKYPDHKGHRSGRDVDIRLFRKDRKEAAVTRFDTQYDRDATAMLIGMFLDSPVIQVIYFNDLTIPRVKPLAHHDDHFHITTKE